jgi:hypothetical protein
VAGGCGWLYDKKVEESSKIKMIFRRNKFPSTTPSNPSTLDRTWVSFVRMNQLDFIYNWNESFELGYESINPMMNQTEI